MIRQGRTILFALLVCALVLPLQGADVPTAFVDTHYYILSLGEMSVDLSTLIQTAQSSGYSLLQFGEVDIEAQDAASALDDQAVLVTDGSRFYLREKADTYVFTVRPAELGYELVINPLQELVINDSLATILVRLQELGILGSDVNLDFASFAKADLKGPSAPDGVFIDSTLYGLTVAEDWFAFSAAKGLTQVGLRVEIVAEKVPGGVLDPKFLDYVIEETESLVKLLLPIDELLALAKSSSIGYVRIAYQPAVP